MKENESTVDICTEAHAYIIGKIKKEHPEWIEKDGPAQNA